MAKEIKAQDKKDGTSQYGRFEESVEQIDEGLMNDIRDFIVAVGASLPTKKNKKARTDKTLEDQVRYAMQADPEFDKLVRNVVSVRKDGVAAFRNGGKEALQKYVAKTVDAEAAKKLGTLQTRWMKVKKDGSVGKATSNTYGKKFKDEKDDPTKHKNVEDMYLTHIATTEKIGKIIKQVAVRAQREAQQEKKRSSKPLSAVRFKKESVEQTDEMSNKLLNRYSDAAKKDTKKDRTKGMRKARNIRTQRANKGLFGSDIGEEVEQVDEARPASNAKNYVRKGGNKEQFKWKVTLNNRKTKTVSSDSRRNVKHSLSPEQLIIGIKSAKKIEESVEQTDEAYTVQQRVKAKQRMKKMSKRIQMAKKRAMKRAPTMDKLKLRARKQAKGALVSKWMRGKSKGEMSFSQRQNIEKRLKSASGRIDTMSKKLLPSVRAMDRDRRANAKNKSEEK